MYLYITAYVSESVAPGTKIAVLSYSDPDASSNGQVDVRMYVRNDVGNTFPNYFILDEDIIKTGRALDRETIPRFFIDIRACDQGNDRR